MFAQGSSSDSNRQIAPIVRWLLAGASRNAAVGRTAARADVSGDNEADPERLAALIKALTGRELRIRRWSDGGIGRVLQRTSGGFHVLYRACGCCGEVARGVFSGGCSMAPVLCGLLFRILVVFLFLFGRLLRRVV